MQCDLKLMFCFVFQREEEKWSGMLGYWRVRVVVVVNENMSVSFFLFFLGDRLSAEICGHGNGRCVSGSGGGVAREGR
jgi:hypothetical protein